MVTLNDRDLDKGVEEWREVLGDDVMAATPIACILHHWHIVTIRGDCHRMRQHSELWQALQRLRGVGNSLTREGEGGHNGLNRARYLRRRSAQISPA